MTQEGQSARKKEKADVAGFSVDKELLDRYCVAYAIGNILSWTVEGEKERYWANDLEQRKLHAQLMLQAGFDPQRYLWRMPVPNPINDFQRFINELDRLAGIELEAQRRKARDVRVRA